MRLEPSWAAAVPLRTLAYVRLVLLLGVEQRAEIVHDPARDRDAAVYLRQNGVGSEPAGGASWTLLERERMDPVTRAHHPIRVVNHRKVKLIVAQGPDSGLTAEVAGALVRIGTSPENDLVLNDDTVSRRHCEIMLTDDGIRVIDAGSRNGVVVGNIKIQDATFSEVTSLQLGETLLSVVPLSEMVSREQFEDEQFGDMVGRSPKMRELFAALLRISGTNLSVLIEGETGTGKELVAESIHQASPRAQEPFVVFDCSAVAASLAESELFGHERGAFTGAVAPRMGVFEQAHGGTIFLDELGELPKDLQPKLLRVLEKREIRRVGGSKTIPIDVRLIAATNRNLRSEVKRGAFREDLYYRVAGAHVYVPPLRDRLEDLSLLAQRFLQTSQPRRSLNEIPPHIWEMFRSYRWPGNVRELRNAINRVTVTPERALDHDLYAESSLSSVPNSTDEEQPVVPLRIARRNAADHFDKTYVTALLKRANGNITRAAALAEVSRQAIYALLTKHGLDKS